MQLVTRRVETLVPAAQLEADTVDEALGAASNFVNSFKDNPARRLYSLLIGALLGMGVAALTGTDLFQAVLHPGTAATGFGVAVTGFIVGLRSSPTHEVIRLLQEVKERHKVENQGP